MYPKLPAAVILLTIHISASLFGIQEIWYVLNMCSCINYYFLFHHNVMELLYFIIIGLTRGVVSHQGFSFVPPIFFKTLFQGGSVLYKNRKIQFQGDVTKGGVVVKGSPLIRPPLKYSKSGHIRGVAFGQGEQNGIHCKCTTVGCRKVSSLEGVASHERGFRRGGSSL
jgi:hypothetical protein